MNTRNPTPRAEERILWGGKPRRAATTHQTPEAMQRITIANLERLCKHINRARGTPEEPYTLNNGEYTQNPGCICLDGAYGGWNVEELLEHGSRRVLDCGYVPKRELYNLLHAYWKGIERA